MRAVDLAGSVAQHRLLDRLIRGRMWIGVLAFALIGIVAMQLCLLKLNAGIGRAIEHEGLLQRQNTALRIANSEASSGDRVEQLAAAEGMGTAEPGTQHFLSAHGAEDTRRAAAALAKPVKASSFTASASAATTSTETGSGTETSASTANTTATTASTTPSGANGTPSAGVSATPGVTEATGTGTGTTGTATATSSPSATVPSSTTATSTGASTPEPSGSAGVSPTVGGTQASSGG